jgi:hypothetical protein
MYSCVVLPGNSFSISNSAAESMEDAMVTARTDTAPIIVAVHLYEYRNDIGFSTSSGSHPTTNGFSSVPSPVYGWLRILSPGVTRRRHGLDESVGNSHASGILVSTGDAGWRVEADEEADIPAWF